jgi:hypothetical protein
MKKLAQFGSVKVYGRNQCGEYEVRSADGSIYYTDEKDDAIDTAKFIDERSSKQEVTE